MVGVVVRVGDVDRVGVVLFVFGTVSKLVVKLPASNKALSDKVTLWLFAVAFKANAAKAVAIITLIFFMVFII
ncbi:hypothetical protein GCM10007352_13630 [Mucilaginibacter phyllosphaerae]|nr:hypothetical protein GCM10007352_13630 [Mucilaginibacter phyllosphaerae]